MAYLQCHKSESKNKFDYFHNCQKRHNLDKLTTIIPSAPSKLDGVVWSNASSVWRNMTQMRASKKVNIIGERIHTTCNFTSWPSTVTLTSLPLTVEDDAAQQKGDKKQSYWLHIYGEEKQDDIINEDIGHEDIPSLSKIDVLPEETPPATTTFNEAGLQWKSHE